MQRPLPRQPQNLTVPMGPPSRPVPIVPTAVPPYGVPPQNACSLPQQACRPPLTTTCTPPAAAYSSPHGVCVPRAVPVVPNSNPISALPNTLGPTGLSRLNLGMETATRHARVRRSSCLRTSRSSADALWLAGASLFGLASLAVVAAVVAAWPALCGLHLKPIPDIVCHTGDRIVTQFEVEQADYWRNRIEYRVHVAGSTGATYDQKTGRFDWHTDRPGRYNVIVTVRKNTGFQSDRKSFTVLVKSR